ncbi:hypothetical protein [Luteimonas sp. R10]|uniref:hypothetical protein n=1 Tax=Luteimonas sp. R10 TaxID=3108176 RepID=UPI003086D6BB|nr:hypothetical protein U3649_10315 [Luteimonas sp. R10]
MAARRKPLLWLLVLACAVLVILAFLQLSARMSGLDTEGRDTPTGRETFGQTAPATQAPVVDPSGTVERRGAVIVDDPAADETRAALAAIASATGGDEAEPPARARANASANAGGTRRHAPAASRTPPKRASPTATATQPATGNDLISTLLRIIKQDGAASAQQHESMDALIAQVQAEDDRARNQNSAALASLGGAQSGTTAPPAPARSPVVQEKLRACPKANTIAGIECRSRVCAQHAGEDAACPQQ